MLAQPEIKENGQKLLPVVQPEPAKPKLSDRAREQTLLLASYLSMNGEFSIETITPENVVAKIARIVEFNTASFDGHPTLAQVGPELMRFYTTAEQQVVPQLGIAQVDTVDDLIVGLMLEIGSRAYANNVLLAWQAESDRRCRAGFQRIMPLIELIASPLDKLNKSDQAITISCGASDGAVTRVQARYTFGKDLSNVTLRVVLGSLDKRESEHYYFFESFASDEVISLRLAANWASIGSLGTFRGTVEVWSDEFTARPSMFRIDANLTYAAERLTREMGLVLRKRPKWVAQRLHPVRNELDECKSCDQEVVRSVRKQISELIIQANNFLGEESGRLTATIEQLSVLERALGSVKNKESPGQRGERQQRIRVLKKQINELIEQRRELNSLIDD